jgi:hypothetical protein
MRFDIKPYFAENPAVAANYDGSGRVFSVVNGMPTGGSIGATVSQGSDWGVINAPYAGVWYVTVRCVDCPDANAPNGLGVYEQSFCMAVYGVGNSGWAAGWKYDSNTKSVTSLVAATGGDTYETLLVPMGNPAQAWRNPNTWNDLVNGNETIGSNSYNRRYNTTPGFVGGLDVPPGKWALIIRSKTNTTDLVVFELTLGTVNLEGFIGTSTPNNAPVLPDFTFPPMIVGQYWTFNFPVATDSDGPQGLTYTVTGISALPTGIFETFSGGVRTWSGWPRQTNSSSHNITYSAFDGVNTTSRTKTQHSGLF